jgi:polysaccharide biosynthesis protein PelE
MRIARFLAHGLPLAVDAAACAFVIDGRGALGFGVHAFAAGLAFLVSLRSLRAGSPLIAAASASVLVLALPAVGALVLALVVWPSWQRELDAGAGTIIEVALPDGMLEAEAAVTGELAPTAPRPIRELLRGAGSPDQRIRAVMTLRHMEARRAVPLLRQAFAHESEDVRLLAFGILEQREKRLRARIKRSEARLANARASDDGISQHRRLARDHWELVYGGFVSGDLEPLTLGRASEHAAQVLAREADANMALLLARIHLRKREPDQAWAELERAERAGLSRASSAPLFAEAAFQMRRFGEIPTILRGVRRAQLRRPELEPVAEFWTNQA